MCNRAAISSERRTGLSLSNVRFGSETDICSAKGHVRFGESGFPQTDSGADPTRLDHQMFGDEANTIFQYLVALFLVSLDLCERG